MANESSHNTTESLHPYLSPAAAWALSVGTSIGWGSLVVTSSNYLSQAGPLGSVLGLIIGGLLMLMIGRNFHYLANMYPDAGGAYTYTRNLFGYDQAFLLFWFLSLTYISMFWANATSLSLFARYFLKGVFRFGYLYTVFGFEVYLGEVLLAIAVIGLVTLLCIRSKEAASTVMVVLVMVFTIGISVCFFFAMANKTVPFEPAFLPDRKAVDQILMITFISPWAFIGFESITHSSEEFNFKTDKLFRIFFISLITCTLLYIFVILLSVTAYPEGCGSWLEYITHLNDYEGIDGLPAFYAANHYLGKTGLYILMASLLSLILTSLIGNLRALSRLFYAAALDDILPAKIAELNEKQIPKNAMLLAACLSLPIPFLGRTAIGWIVDITTIGATMIYGFVSAAAYKAAKHKGDRHEIITGAAGFLIMVFFGIYLLFPNLFSSDMLETETYVLLVVWSIIGFFYFRRIIAKDHARRFGKAIIVWVSLLAMIVFMTMIWTGRRDESITRNAIDNIRNYYEGNADPKTLAMEPDEFIREDLNEVHRSNVLNTMITSMMFMLALSAMLINHFSMRRWELEIAKERDTARKAAYTDPLTGVKSKHSFVEYEQDIAEKIYNGEAKDFALIVCDVNGLKQINDTLGHQVGDKYIQSACSMICEYYKHSPVFRIGGDEFAVILRGQDFENRFDIMNAFNEKIEKNIGTSNVVASIGMADFDPETDNTFHSVFTRADAKMYERKMELKRMGAVIRD